MTTSDRPARYALTGAGLMLAWLAAMNTGRVIDMSPALEDEARETGIYGDWRVSVSPALYDRAEYLFQVAHGYVHSDTLASGTIEAGDEIADLLVIDERSSEAIALLEESLGLAPGNAFAWDTLAWAHGLSGDIEAAGQALSVSRQLAPHNLDLALSRLTLEMMLRDVELFVAELDLPEDEAIEAVALPEDHDADLAVARLFVPLFYDSIAEQFPDLAPPRPDTDG